MQSGSERPDRHHRWRRMGFVVRALSYRNYRLFFGGQVVSLAGTWITTTATSWLVYRITREGWKASATGSA